MKKFITSLLDRQQLYMDLASTWLDNKQSFIYKGFILLLQKIPKIEA